MLRNAAAAIAAITVTASLMPAAYANTFVNEAFAGSYLSAGATSDNYASLDILSITDSTVSVRFRFVKNNNEQLIYSFSDGTMNDTTGTIRFTVSYQDGSYVTGGTMTLTLDSWCVRLNCDSDQGQHLFDGIMYPQFSLDPYTAPTSGPTFTNTSPAPDSGISVVLNGSKVAFPVNVSPTIINDYTYVPLRSLFGDMGINVYWDDYQRNTLLRAQMITCTKNSTIVQFMRTYNETGNNAWSLSKWEGTDTSSAVKTDIPIGDIQPVIINDSTYVPLRVISEAFGAAVEWNGDTKTVSITCDTGNAYWHDASLIANIENYKLENAQSYITADYYDVSADTIPYYSPDTKFYLFSARDQWNPVTLRVSYGGYIDLVVNEESAAVTDTAAETPAPAVDPAAAQTPAEPYAAETPAETPTEAPAETPAETTADTPEQSSGGSVSDTE